MNIVLTDPAHLLPDAIERIQKLPATLYDVIPTDEEEVIRRIKDAEIISTSFVGINKRIIDAAPSLKHIIVPAAGYQGVDAQYAKNKGITLSNCPTHNAQAVAEHAIGLMFAVARKTCEACSAVRQGKWGSAPFQGLELSGRSLGLIGHGNIGQRIESMAQGIGMRVEWVDVDSPAGSLELMLQRVDVVCLCIPLTEQTFHIIDQKRLGIMKPASILINVSRGGVVDIEALAKILESHGIGGAGLDVFEGEPIVGEPLHTGPGNDEYIGSLRRNIVELARLPNVVATPHMGYKTIESAQRQGEELYANLVACMSGKPQNVVNA